mgnify:CR=1 FL=1
MKNLKLKALIILIPFLCNKTFSQSSQFLRQPITLNVNSHTSYQASPYILDWSLGENICVNTLSSTQNFMMTMGVLQNNITPIYSTQQEDSMGQQIYVGPLPVHDLLFVSTNQNNIQITKLIVTDQWGREQVIIKGPFAGLCFKKSIPFSSASTGFYFLMIHYVVGQSITRIKIFKIIKV